MTAEESLLTDIFISYKRENLGAVQCIVEGLRRAGLGVWWDQDIAPDAPWETTIERELEAAKVVIVAWSDAAAASENVKAEARRARTQGKLIQVFVEPCDPPLFFGERQGVDLSGWSGDANDSRFKTVVEAAQAIRAGRKPPRGVGYAAKKRTPWAALTSVLVFIGAALGVIANFDGARSALCSIDAVRPVGQSIGLCGAEAPPEAAGPTRESILASLNGVWSNTHIEPRCAIVMNMAVTRGEDGVDRLRVTDGQGFDSTLQVVSVDPAGRMVSVRDAEEREYRYHVAGDALELTEPPSAEDPRPRITPLIRCG